MRRWQTWNASEVGRSFGVSNKTAERDLDLLCGSFLARRLSPWHENLGKRLCDRLAYDIAVANQSLIRGIHELEYVFRPPCHCEKRGGLLENGCQP